jgi:FKBP-type peptidyl-prolyl cis-trans isomerase
MLRLRYVENNNSNSMIKKVYQTAILLVVAGLLLSLGSCDPSAKYEKQEKESIADYLSNSDMSFTKQESGLYYHEVSAGTGVTPAPGDTAYVTYTGKYLDGVTFDSNVDKTAFPFAVGTGYVIAGLDEGVTYMSVGGKSVLLIPSNLGYGSQGYYTIGGFTPLIFEVELKEVVPGAK